MSTTSTTMSETRLRWMAKHDPTALVAWIRGEGRSATSGLLSRAAECLGLVADRSLAEPLLFELLGHPEAVVQEGAIYGLDGHLTTAAREQLARIALDERAHSTIREAAREALES